MNCLQEEFEEEVEASVGGLLSGYVRSRVHLSGVNATTNVTCTATNHIDGDVYSDAHMFTLIVPGVDHVALTGQLTFPSIYPKESPKNHSKIIQIT